MHQLLLDNADRQPDHVGLTWLDRSQSLTNAQAVVAMQAMAGALTHLGVRPNDRVTIVAHNGMDYLMAMLGAWRIGAIAALVNVKFENDLADYFADHSPAVVIYTHDMHAAVANAASLVTGIRHLICMDGAQPGALSLPELLKAQLTPAADPGDESAIAHLSYTSGTTGRPKGACLAHEPTVRACKCIAERLRLRAHDISLCPTALSSSYHLVSNLLAPMSVGAKVQVMRFWTAPAGWQALDDTASTFLIANPTLLQELLTESLLRGAPPRHLRFGLSGGGPVPASLKRAWRDRLGLPLVESFGQSELGGFMALGYPELEPDDKKLIRVGRPLPDKEVWIADEAGQRLAAGQVGNIVLKGGFMTGYWGNDAATKTTIRGTQYDQLVTGDVGLMDDEGFVTMRGRRSELIQVDGQCWYPRDIEEALCELDEVSQAAVVTPAPKNGTSAPIGFITLSDAAAGQAIDLAKIKQQAQALLSCKIDVLRLHVIPKMPLTVTGKIAKSELAAFTFPG